MASSDRFGFEWDKYRNLIPEYERQFRGWIMPLGPEDYKGKKVLDAGCGMGRNSYWPLKWGADYLMAFDADQRSVDAANKTLSGFLNKKVFQKDIYQIDFNSEFDIVMCVGVIHHLEFPERAIKNLVKSLRPGGKLVIWVYSYEDFELYVKVLTPLRKYITSRLPIGFLHFCTYFITAPFYLFLKVIPWRKSYFKLIKNFRFWHIHSIIFDQLLPAHARYYTKEQARALLHDLKDIQISHPNNNGWAVVGKKL